MTTAHITIPEHEMPLWMRQARRGVDWGVLAVIALSLAAAWPFLMQPDLPRTNDTEHYVFQAADAAQALREGRLYSRWSPHAMNGYGAPIAHYYPPAAPYSAALIDVFFTNNIVLAVRVVYVLAFCLAGTMVYAFVLRYSGAAAGVLAALLYVYSPHVGLITPHISGDLAHMLTLALLPTYLWAINRLLMRNHPFDMALCAVVVAALILTDPRMMPVALVLGVVLFAHYAVWVGRLQDGLRLFWACAFGILLAAFYWLPALIENPLVQWLPPFSDQPAPMLTLAAVFSAAQQIDPAALLPRDQYALGSALLIFIPVSLWTLLILQRGHFHLVFCVTGAALLMSTLLLMPTQPWLLGAITLCFAIAASGVMQWRYRLTRAQQRVLFAACVILIFVLSFPVWLSVDTDMAAIDGITPEDQLAYEQRNFGIAVLPDDAPIPVTIALDVPVNRLLLSEYATQTVNRFSNDVALRNEASVLEMASHRQRYQLRLRQSHSNITMLLAHFPGWQATLGAESIDLQPSPQGLISLDLPATNAELTVWLGATPVRSLAWGITWLILALLMGMVVLRARRFNRTMYDETDLLGTGETRLLALVLTGLLSITVLFDTPISPSQLRAQGEYALRDAVFVGARNTAGLEVYAYHLAPDRLQPGDTLTLTLFWQAQRTLTENYQVRVQLRDVQTHQSWAMTDLRSPGYYPTRRWLAGRYVRDVYQLTLPPDAPPGRYIPIIEAFRCQFDCSPDDRLVFFDANGQTMGRIFTLPRIITLDSP